MGRTLVVGDLHGCFDELRDLLESAGFERGDRLISVGDLVGKGPRGADVVRFFREGGHLAVRGNHDEKVLGARGDPRSLPRSHQRDALALSEHDWAWLDALPYSLALPEHDAIVVHAGLVPGVPLSKQDPLQLTTMRSLREDGTPSKRVDAGVPWASRWRGPPFVIFGHDALRGLQRWPHAVGLDTGCVYGGRLSAYVFPERRVVSVPSRAHYAALEGA